MPDLSVNFYSIVPQWMDGDYLSDFSLLSSFQLLLVGYLLQSLCRYSLQLLKNIQRCAAPYRPLFSF